MQRVLVFAMFLSLPIVAAVIILFVYFLFYKRRVNRALDENTNVTPIPEPDKAARIVCVVFFAVCLVMLLVKISTISNTVSNLQSVDRNSINELRNQVAALSDAIQNMNEEQESIFTSFDYKCTAADFSTYLATIRLTAIPKTAAEDAKITFHCGNAHAELKKDDAGRYSGTVKINIFEDPGNEAFLILTSDGQDRTESVDFYSEELWQDFLPSVDMDDYDFEEGEIDYKKETLTVNKTITVNIQVKKYDVKKVWAVTSINGKTVDETDVTNLLERTDDGYRAAIPFKGNYTEPTLHYARLYLKYEDTAGLLHEMLLGVMEYDSLLECFVEEINFSEKLLDPKGNVLYEW